MLGKACGWSAKGLELGEIFSAGVGMGSPVWPWVHAVFYSSDLPVMLITSYSSRTQNGNGMIIPHHF